VQETIQDICERAGTLLTSWQNAQVTRHVQPNILATPVCAQWKKSSPGRYKCNEDASFSNFLNKVGIGLCIRDEDEHFVLAKTDWFAPIVDIGLRFFYWICSVLNTPTSNTISNTHSLIDLKIECC